MASATSVLVSVGALTLGLVILRRWRSSKWGRCTLPTKLTGKVVIVTGGNVGLGAETALDLAGRGATVVLACRSEDTSLETVTRIRKQTGNTDVHYMHLDLANLESVRQFAGDLLEKYPNIYCLVCNAGVWCPMDQEMKTSQGLEIHAGVNHLGHFLLTSLLLERLCQSSPSRLVLVSSSLSSQGTLDLEKFDHFREGRQAVPGSKSFAPTGYCDSKLMNVLFCKELSSRVAGRGLTTVSVCPGWCKTELARHTGIKLYQGGILDICRYYCNLVITCCLVLQLRPADHTDSNDLPLENPLPSHCFSLYENSSPGSSEYHPGCSGGSGETVWWRILQRLQTGQCGEC